MKTIATTRSDHAGVSLAEANRASPMSSGKATSFIARTCHVVVGQGCAKASIFSDERGAGQPDAEERQAWSLEPLCTLSNLELSP